MTTVNSADHLRRDDATPSTLMRWWRFNLVGAIGIGVQFAALFVVKGVLHFNYLAATAVAVEAAVVHNFVWHDQFTWADRTRSDRTNLANTRPDRRMPDRRRPSSDPLLHNSDAETSQTVPVAEKLCLGWCSAFSAAIRLSFSAKALAAEVHKTHVPAGRTLCAALKRCATQSPYCPSIARFLRFNLTVGAVSIIGNLALMKVMVGIGGMNYLVANGIAIGLCSLANFLVSENWVFAAGD
jgi:putative flippase GtrA